MDAQKRSKLRWMEFAAILVIFVIGAILALPVIQNSMDSIQPGTCQDNLRQWGVIFKMYSKENDYRWPVPHGFEEYGSASNAPGCRNVEDRFDFSPDERVLIPDYLNDPLLYACPNGSTLLPPVKVGPAVLKPWRLDPFAFGIVESEGIGSCENTAMMTNGDASYTYLGWRIDPFDASHPIVTRPQALIHGLPAEGPAAIIALLAFLQPNEEQTYLDVQAKRVHGINPSLFLSPLGRRYANIGNFGADLLTVLWHGIGYMDHGAEEPPNFPWLAVTPVMWDTIRQDASGNPTFTHDSPQGVNVLYLDGHVEFKTYPGDVFPVIPSFATMKPVP
jgi:prepilin-type processing-associated H-X9-DG protein